jgi:hypothetical protein
MHDRLNRHPADLLADPRAQKRELERPPAHLQPGEGPLRRDGIK